MSKKGNVGELKVAKLLKEWWGQAEPGCKFVRVPLSGGWLHGPDFNACGDVMTNAAGFPFAIEVKRRERWDPQRLVEGRTSPVWGWWRQCQEDARKAHKEPMLWFRQNRRPWLVMLRRRYVAGLKVAPPDVVWTRARLAGVRCGANPVVYLGHRLLEQDPRAFVAEVAYRKSLTLGSDPANHRRRG